jgi:para-aminobenzoate synthetase component 1
MPSPQIYPLSYCTDSQTWFESLHQLPGSVWLDSGNPRSYNARYDILSALPREQISSLPGGCDIQHRDGRNEKATASTLAYLESRLANLREAQSYDTIENDDRPFTGGAIGYLGYEAMHQEFGLAPKPDDRPDLPDSYFGIYDWALIQDHLKREAYLFFLPDCPNEIIDRVRQQIDSGPTALPSFTCGPLLPDISRNSYLDRVERAQAYIRAGDCYQVNFTQRFAGDFSGSTAAAYLRLREALPSPFSAYMDLPVGTLLSLSPERFVELNGRRVCTQPIKGTAPRGASPAEDDALARELQASEKNRAENVMIVDLLRNDLSKVCEPFSVEVPELFSLQTFANVHHLVSTVTGTLRDSINQFDLLNACFPGGSITGAPKKRAMEVIDELEEHKRSVYCGSVIYMSLNGRMDSSIAIRTLVQSDDRIYCWGGGGIVSDSDPELEYQESLHKIGLLLETLRLG